MKSSHLLVLVLGLPFAVGCGLVLGIEDRAVTNRPDAATADGGADDVSIPDGPDTDVADAPVDVSADADAGLFDPKSLSGLELWLDGDRGLITNPVEVTEWKDQSGNARNLVRGNAVSPSIIHEKFPGTTHDAARFVPDAAGPAGYLVVTGFTLPQPLTIAVAVYPTRVTAGFFDLFLGGNVAPTIALGRSDAAFKSSAGSGPTFSQLLAANTWTMAPHILVAVFDGASSSLTVDGVTESGTLSDAPLPNGVNLSSSSAFHGYIGEVLIYSRNLGAAERASVGGYLTARYVP